MSPLNDRKMEIQRRRGILVTALRNANRYSMILYGRRFFEDVSLGETEFRRVFLDIPILFSWLVNESGIDPTWIPYKIREWVKEHPTENESEPSAEKAINSSAEPRVHFIFDTANELLQLTVDGTAMPTKGRFLDGTKLLLEIWNAPKHRLAKSDFDKIHPDIRDKGKGQLRDKIGSSVFGDVYKDERGGDMWLTDKIVVERQSAEKR